MKTRSSRRALRKMRQKKVRKKIKENSAQVARCQWRRHEEAPPPATQTPLPSRYWINTADTPIWLNGRFDCFVSLFFFAFRGSIESDHDSDWAVAFYDVFYFIIIFFWASFVSVLRRRGARSARLQRGPTNGRSKSELDRRQIGAAVVAVGPPIGWCDRLIDSFYPAIAFDCCFYFTLKPTWRNKRKRMLLLLLLLFWLFRSLRFLRVGFSRWWHRNWCRF